MGGLPLCRDEEAREKKHERDWNLTNKQKGGVDVNCILTALGEEVQTVLRFQPRFV